MSRAITITSSCAGRIGALVRLLGSDRDGEALGAVYALRRTLAAVGSDLHHLAHVVEHGLGHRDGDRHGHPDHAALVARCWRERARLSTKESDFIYSMLRWQGAPTERQAAWLLAIADKLGGT